MKKISFLLLAFFWLIPTGSFARPPMSLSIFGGPNFQLTSAFPNLDVGAGGGLAFDYRFNQHWGLASSLSVFPYNGEGISAGDRNMLLLNIPNINLKFFWLKSENKFDPYLTAGLGLSVLTGGSKSDNSGGAGISTQLGIGADYYFNDRFSAGALTQFHSIGLIRGSSQSSALIFIGVLGNFAFHF